MTITKKKITYIFIGVIALLFLFFLGSIFETNTEGYIQVKQAAITGEMSVRMTPGLYFQNFGTIWTYNRVGTIGFGDHKGEKSGDIDAIPVIFNDGSKATISGLVRIRLPETVEGYFELKKEFAGGYDHFIQSGVVPIVKNAVKLAANLRSAQDAYTTLALFQQAVEDQLRNGIYMTESKTILVERTTGEPEERQVTAIVYYPEDSKEVDEYGQSLAGQPKRIADRFKDLNCEVNECVISIPEFDAKVTEMIDRRKEEAMKTELAKQAAIRAQQDALTAEEQGKANVATAKYEKEVELVRAVTKARENFEVAQFNAKKAEQEKLQKIQVAKGVAEELRIADGLSARQKFQIEQDVARSIGVAEALSKWVAPQIVVLGQDGKGGNGVENALMIQMMRELVNKK
jgi:hypothetical protein